MNETDKLQKTYNIGRSNLLTMTVFSAINILLMVFKASIYFPFCASAPLLLVQFGQLFYAQTGSALLFAAFICVAAIILAFYTICYILSKKHPAWFIVALVFFAIDTLILLGFIALDYNIDFLLDVLFHAWVLFYLIRGVVTIPKLKKQNAIASNAGADGQAEVTPSAAEENKPAPATTEKDEDPWNIK